MSFTTITHRWMATVFILTVGLFANASAAAATLHVDGNATATPSDGSTWANAFTDIQSSIDAAVAGDEIWVAAGVYTGEGDNVIELKEGVNIYGGFAGNETQRDQRDWKANETIIDGENTRRGVYADSIDISTLNGFTIRNGNAEDGGGMYNYSSTTTINNCTFTRNAANQGGGMYTWGIEPVITNCAFVENTADEDGGGLYGYPTILNGCTFANNSAKKGGGIYIKSPWRLTDCLISYCIFFQNTATHYGGGMYAVTSKSTLESCTFTENFSLNGGGIYYTSTSMVAINCTFNKNKAKDGGGMYFIQTNRVKYVMEISGCSFLENIAQSRGGGIFNDNHESTLTVTKCSFIGNETASQYYGGAGMFSMFALVTITDSSFTVNTTPGNGAGMYNHNCSPQISRCTFTENTANAGGGLYNIYRASPNLENCIFTNNNAKFGGGGICDTQNASPTLTGCEFFGNKADSGGGMYNSISSSPTLSDCTFTENKADNGGGMLNHWYCSPKISSCVFIRNTLNDDYRRNVGGGIYNISIHSSQIINSTFIENTADRGGGMYNRDSSPTITGCTFTRNIVEEEDGGSAGAGLYNDNSSPTVANSTFTENTADRGGAIYDENSSPVLDNCLIIKNTAGRGGGMYHANGSLPSLTNCTIADNIAELFGAGLYNNNSIAVINNCIIWNQENKNIYIYGDSAPVITYSCVRGGYEGEGNIAGDPLFIDAAGGNYQLAANSPCIDAGTADGAPESDLLGERRPHGGGIDMGAYELNPNSATDPAWLLDCL